MSSHHCNSTMNGKPVKVMAGFDRPLDGFFLVVEDADGTFAADDYIYSNLDDPLLLRWGGLPPELDYFVSKLKELRIEVPQRLLDEVKADGVKKAGNRTVRYDDAGKMSER